MIITREALVAEILREADSNKKYDTYAYDFLMRIVSRLEADGNRIEALKADNAKLRDALFPFAEFHQLGGSMNDPISMWFRVAPFADAAYALQETGQ